MSRIRAIFPRAHRDGRAGKGCWRTAHHGGIMNRVSTVLPEGARTVERRAVRATFLQQMQNNIRWALPAAEDNSCQAKSAHGGAEGKKGNRSHETNNLGWP